MKKKTFIIRKSNYSGAISLGVDKLITEAERSLIPREFKHYLTLLEPSELLLLKKVLKNINSSKTPFMHFSQKVLALAKADLGKNPNLEFLAANIAYELRQLDDLEKIAKASKNYFTLIPLIKGLVAKNSLNRAIANIRIVEARLASDDLIYQIDFYLAKSLYSVAKGSLTDGLFQLLSAKEFLSSYENEIEVLYANTLRAQILLHECEILLSMSRYTKAYDIINSGLSLAKKIDHKVLIALFELYYGNYLIEFMNEPEVGNQHHRKAAAIARSLMNPYLIAKTLMTIGSNLRLQKNIEEGIRFCKHAEKMFQKMHDYQEQAIAINKIAGLEIAYGQISAATNRLLDLESKKINNPQTNLNLTLAFLKADDLDSAELYLEKARTALRGRGDLAGEFYLIYYEGLIEFCSGNFSKAEFLFANAQEFAELSKLERLSLKASLQLVSVLVSKNVAKPSKRNFKKAKIAILDLQGHIKKDEHSQDYNELEFFKASLLFSNREYIQAEKIFKRLEKYYSKLQLFEKINAVQDYLHRIENYRQLGFLSSKSSQQASFDEFERTPAPLIVSSKKVNRNEIIELGTHPILLLILSSSGLPLYSHYFTDVFGKIDETLVSGFLGAIISFTEKMSEGTKTSYLKQGFLQGIKHGDFDILLEPAENCIVALVTDKESYLIRKQLKRFAEELNVLFLKEEEPIIVLGEENRFYIESLVKRIF